MSKHVMHGAPGVPSARALDVGNVIIGFTATTAPTAAVLPIASTLTASDGASVAAGPLSEAFSCPATNKTTLDELA